MSTAKAKQSLPSVTSKELGEFGEDIKKQFEHLNAAIESSQAKLLDKMLDMLRGELRELTVSNHSKTSNHSRASKQSIVTGTDENATKKAPPTQKADFRKSLTKATVVMNPFKSKNQKVAGVDELDTVHRRKTINARAAQAKIIAEELERQTSDELHGASGSSHSVRDLSMQTVEAYERLVSPDDRPISPRGDEDNPEDENKYFLAILQNPALEAIIVCLVMLNSLWIGAELEYRLSVSADRPIFFQWVDILFCIIFSAEIAFRLAVLGMEFFTLREPNALWNYFDLILVLSQIMEIAFKYVDVHRRVNMSWLRILRTLRIVRLTRIVRAVRFIEGLRTLVKCVVRGMAATVWITLFLLMQIYTCSLALTELLHEIESSETKDNFGSGSELDLMFGSLTTTMGTLFKSIAGGIDWDRALAPLMETSPPLGFAFVIYCASSIFVILNIFTGFFVNTSSLCAEEDGKSLLRDRVADIFVNDGENQYHTYVDEHLFAERLSSPEMQAYFQSIDLHVDEAEGLFKLLDLDGNGQLDPIECVSALMRMQGSAKALDVRILMFMFAKAQELNSDHLRMLQQEMTSAHGILRSLQELQDQKERTSHIKIVRQPESES